MSGRAKKSERTVKQRRAGRPAETGRVKRQLGRIRGALSLDLLSGSYRLEEDERALKFACMNHCYVATEAAYHMFAKKMGYVPYVFKHPDGSTHWWLVQEETGDVLDPSGPQLGRRKFPYAEGRRAVFLTRRPSRRAAELIRRATRSLP